MNDLTVDDFKVGQRLCFPDLSGTVVAVSRAESILTSRGVVVEPVVTVEWDDGDVTGERPEDLAP